MMSIKHHAIVFDGDREAGLNAAKAYVLDVIGIETSQNPDVSVFIHDRISIEVARNLKERASQRPFGKAQAFIVGCEAVLREAQNALLKVLEEPAENTHFIFVVPSVHRLLPTVRSRLHYAGRVVLDSLNLERAERFMNASQKERSGLVAQILKDNDRAAAQEFVRLLERYLHQRKTDLDFNKLREVALVQKYLNNQSSSLKNLLGHLAVVL